MKLNEFFEQAFYINLDRRTDRREQFEAEMKSVGLEGWVQRVPGIPYTKGVHLKIVISVIDMQLVVLYTKALFNLQRIKD